MDSSKDLSSVLAHVESLQKQLVMKEAEVKESRQREDEARQQANQLSNMNSKLTEAKREAMKEDFNSKVREWIKDLDSKQVPEPLKEEFLNSCEKFADTGNETGVWKVRDLIFQPLCTKLTASAGRVLRVGRPPKPSQHHPKTDGGLQCAQEDDRRRGV
jgi:type II secretory pathway component PulJ